MSEFGPPRPAVRARGVASAARSIAREIHLTVTSPSRRALLTNYLLGQTAVMVLGQIPGLLLVRVLDYSEFAQFSVAFAAQSLMTTFVDLGVVASLIGTIGERHEDATFVHSVIASSQGLRKRLFAVTVVVSAPVFYLLTARQPWSVADRTWLFVAVASTVFATIGDLWRVPLLLAKRINSVSAGQAIGIGMRLVWIAVLWPLGLLNGVTAALSTTIWFATTAAYYRHLIRAMPGAAEARYDRAVARELVHQTVPILPSAIFYSFQSNLSVFLIAALGGSTAVAEVGALNKIAQVLALVSLFGVLVIEPYMARASEQILHQRYLTLMAALVLLAAAMVTVGRLYPEGFLIVVGHRYEPVANDVWIVTLTASMNLTASMIFIVNRARRFTYWWTNISFVVGTVLAEAAILPLLDLTKVRDILWVNVAIAGVQVVLGFATNLVGFRQGPREYRYVVEPTVPQVE